MNYEEWLEWREEYFKEGVNLLNEEEDCKITGEIIMANKENRKQETKKVPKLTAKEKRKQRLALKRSKALLNKKKKKSK